MKHLLIGLMVKLLFASNTYAKTGYYSYTAYTYINKYYKKRYLKIIPPVKGVIYKKKFYKGIFIKPYSHQKYVRAVLPGKVIFCDYIKYYGYVIIIRHKDQLKTVYAKIIKPYVRKGMYVTKGQIIGLLNPKKEFYFEARKRTIPLNVYALLR